MGFRKLSFSVVMSMGMPQRPVSGREPGCRRHPVTPALPGPGRMVTRHIHRQGAAKLEQADGNLTSPRRTT